MTPEYVALQHLRKGIGLADPARLLDLPAPLRGALGLDQRDPQSVAAAVSQFQQAIDALSPGDRAIAVLTWNVGYSNFDLPEDTDPPIDAPWTQRCQWAIEHDFLPWADTGSVRRQSDRVVFGLAASLAQRGEVPGSHDAPALPGGPRAVRSMRAARHQIVEDMVNALSNGSDENLLLVGGRIRLMSDIVREVLRNLPNTTSVDDPPRRLVIYALDPGFTAQHTLPGQLSPSEQLARNAASASLTTAIEGELTDRARRVLEPRNITFDFVYYQGPPLFYCYLIGSSTLYWGPFTWSAEDSDWAGPTNECLKLSVDDHQFDMLRGWFMNRIELFEAQANGETALAQPTTRAL